MDTKKPITEVISHLKEHGPFAGTFSYGGRTIQRIKPSDIPIVSISRWILHTDGRTSPDGMDILTRRITEFGQNILYVNFRKPDTDCNSEDQTVYRIVLS